MRLVSCLFLPLLASLFSTVIGLIKDLPKDYYEIFGMTRETFDKDTLQRSYRKMAKQYHPDKNKDDKDAEKKFIQIAKAFEVLSDDAKRQMYDRFGAEHVDQMNARGGAGAGRQSYDFNFADEIFKQFFGGGFGGGGGSDGEDFFGGGRGRRRSRGSDAKMELRISLEDAYKGTTYKAEISRQTLCKKCNGTGAKNPDAVRTCDACRGSGVRVIMRPLGPGMVQQIQMQCDKCGGRGKMVGEPCGSCKGRQISRGQQTLNLEIKPGCPDGHTIKLSGMADEAPDQDTGDLYVQVHVDEHPKWIRDGPNLYTTVYLTLREGLLGFDSLELTHLDGRKIKSKALQRTDLVTQPDEVIRIEGEGMPIHESSGLKGDLFVTFKLALPPKLTSSQKKAIEAAFPAPSKEHHEL